MNLRARRKGGVTVHTEALNDIMFFLMLFFLLASAVANPQVVKLLIPKAKTGEQLVAKKTVTASIDGNNNYQFERQPVSLQQLEQSINNAARASNELTIILYVDKNVPTQNTVQVIDLANKAKAKLVLAVQPAAK